MNRLYPLRSVLLFFIGLVGTLIAAAVLALFGFLIDPYLGLFVFVVVFVTGVAGSVKTLLMT